MVLTGWILFYRVNLSGDQNLTSLKCIPNVIIVWYNDVHYSYNNGHTDGELDFLKRLVNSIIMENLT